MLLRAATVSDPAASPESRAWPGAGRRERGEAGGRQGPGSLSERSREGRGGARLEMGSLSCRQRREPLWGGWGEVQGGASGETEARVLVRQAFQDVMSETEMWALIILIMFGLPGHVS